MQKKAIVTGGAGFIGSHLIDKLVKENWEVTIIDNLYSGFMQNIAHHGDKIRFIEDTITNRDMLNEVVTESSTIWHFAAMNSVPRSIELPWETNDVNITGTLNILIAAKDNKARKVIYSASSSAYGNAKVEIKDETLPTNPISPYGLSKFSGEEYCRVFTAIYGLPTVALRYFNVFGPRQNPTSPYSAVIPLFTSAMLDDRPITIFGDGKQSRDFTYVENVVQANYLAGISEEEDYSVYNVACGDSISVNDVYKKIEELTGYSFEVKHKSPRVGDVRTSKASIEKIRAAFGYNPLVRFDEGLEKALTWYQKNQNYFD